MTQKNKNIALGFIFILGLLIAYQLAFLPTVRLIQQNSFLLKENIQFKDIKSNYTTLISRKKIADSILEENNFNGISLQNNLLNFLNTQSLKNNFSIINFESPHIFIDKNINTISYQFTLQGEFNELITTIYQLELEHNFGEICHIDFEKKKTYLNTKDFLQCKIIIKRVNFN